MAVSPDSLSLYITKALVVRANAMTLHRRLALTSDIAIHKDKQNLYLNRIYNMA